MIFIYLRKEQENKVLYGTCKRIEKERKQRSQTKFGIPPSHSLAYSRPGDT